MALGVGVLAGCAELGLPLGKGVLDSYLPKRTQAEALQTPRSGAVEPERADARPAPETPEVYRGTGAVARGQATRGEPQVIAGNGEVTLNFVNTDIREVARAVLGEVLRLNYVIDPRVQGAVTVQTSRPLARAAVLPTLETVFRTSGFALVERDGMYRIVPLEAAPRTGGAAEGAGRSLPAGAGAYVVPLRFASAAEVKKVIDPLVPPGGQLSADPLRNVLVVLGAREEASALADLIELLDVDWLAGTSFALHPLRSATPKAVVPELEKIFGDPAEGGPAAGMLRFVPIDRMNAVLVISTSPIYLARAQEWIDRLDRGGDEDTQRIHVYYVQNSRAVDLVAVFSELFASAGARTLPPTLAPGLAATELRSMAPPGGASAPQTGAQTPTDSQRRSTTSAARPTTSAARAGAAGRPAAPAGAAILGGAGGVFGGDGAGRPGQEPQPRIVADEKNNALVIYAKPREYRIIEAALRKLDIVPLQVLIEATIAEVSLNDRLRYGLQWFFREGRNQVTLSELATGAVAPVFPGFGYAVMGSQARTALSALSEVTDVNVISSPQLMVLDHQTAVLQVGDQVPIAIQQARSVIDPAAPLVNTIEFRDTGVILRVTPRVNANGLVFMDIEQEVSDVAATTTSGIDSPTIAQRRLVSVVAVQSGETVALGGLIRDRRTKNKSGIPLLSDIPVLGFLFGSRGDTDARTELLVLITPRVVRNSQEARDVTNELRERLRATRPLGRGPMWGQ